jgi:hypothetical protein
MRKAIYFRITLCQIGKRPLRLYGIDLLVSFSCRKQKRDHTRAASKICRACALRGTAKAGKQIGIRAKGQSVLALDQTHAIVDLVHALAFL